MSGYIFNRSDAGAFRRSNLGARNWYGGRVPPPIILRNGELNGSTPFGFQFYDRHLSVPSYKLVISNPDTPGQTNNPFPVTNTGRSGVTLHRHEDRVYVGWLGDESSGRRFTLYSGDPSGDLRIDLFSIAYGLSRYPVVTIEVYVDGSATETYKMFYSRGTSSMLLSRPGETAPWGPYNAKAASNAFCVIESPSGSRGIARSTLYPCSGSYVEDSIKLESLSFNFAGLTAGIRSDVSSLWGDQGPNGGQLNFSARISSCSFTINSISENIRYFSNWLNTSESNDVGVMPYSMHSPDVVNQWLINGIPSIDPTFIACTINMGLDFFRGEPFYDAYSFGTGLNKQAYGTGVLSCPVLGSFESFLPGSTASTRDGTFMSQITFLTYLDMEGGIPWDYQHVSGIEGITPSPRSAIYGGDRDPAFRFFPGNASGGDRLFMAWKSSSPHTMPNDSTTITLDDAIIGFPTSPGFSPQGAATVSIPTPAFRPVFSVLKLNSPDQYPAGSLVNIADDGTVGLDTTGGIMYGVRSIGFPFGSGGEGLRKSGDGVLPLSYEHTLRGC